MSFLMHNRNYLTAEKLEWPGESMSVSCFTIIPIRLRKTKLRVITNYDRFFIAHINTIKCYKINVVKVVAGLNANWHYFHRSQWPIFTLTKKN